MTLKVSQSKIKTWRKCRAAYHYKYYEKLRKKRISRPFQFGNIIHLMLEEHANGNDPLKMLDKIALDNKKLFSAEREMYGEIVKDVRTIMSAYFDYWDENDMICLRKNKRSAEHEFNIEIDKDIIMTGKIDAVVKANGLKWIGENKTFTHLPNEDHRWRNLQSSVYLRAVEMMGWWDNLSGVCWNYIKSKAPTRPQLLKSGKLSTKYVDTLPSVVLDVIEENNLKKKDYKDLLLQAQGNQRNYFTRLYTPVNRSVVDKVFDGFVDTAREIAKYHGKKKDMNIDRHCEYCDYESICRAELTGSDVDYVKEREFKYEDKAKDDNERETQQ